MPVRCTPIRCTPVKCTPIRCMLIRCTPIIKRCLGMDRGGLRGLPGLLEALLKARVVYSGLKARRAFCTRVRNMLQAYILEVLYLRGLHLAYRRASYRHAGVHLTGIQTRILQACRRVSYDSVQLMDVWLIGVHLLIAEIINSRS